MVRDEAGTLAVSSPGALSGRRIVVTRARSQSGDLERRIEALGGEAVAFPTIEIGPPESYAPLDGAIRKISTYDWVIFTSVNGVEQILRRMKERGRSAELFQAVRVAAIGPETAARLEQAGIAVSLVPSEYRAEGILEGLKRGAIFGKKILLPRAAQARDILPETLREWGADVDVVAAYRTVRPRSDPLELRRLLKDKKVDMVTFASSSTAINFASFFPGDRLAEVLNGAAVACIGPITAQTIADMGVRADVVADEFTIADLVRAIAAYFGSAGAAGAAKGARRRRI